MLTAADYVIIAIFVFLLLLYKIVRDWYGIRDAPRKIDIQAADLLREQGYRIQARAAVKFIDFDLDGKTHRQKVKADLVARRGFRKYVVEVNAKDAGSARSADLRRRLMEYKIAFAPSGMLTVDMDRERIRIITISGRRWLSTLLAASIIASLGAIIYLAMRYMK